MTPAEIRQTGNNWGSFTLETEALANLLVEIAAQLAEHTAVCTPRMVAFSYKGKPFAINANDVSAIGTTSEAGKTYIATHGRPFTCDQTYAEVFTRLGLEASHE